MEEIIERIIRLENEARNIAGDSEDRAKKLDESVKQEVGRLQKELSECAKNKTEAIRGLEASEADKKISEAQVRRDEAIDRLNKIYAEKKEEWVNMIVDSVIGGK